MLVYVIGPDDGPQKIGVSKDLLRRTAQLQSGNGFTLNIAKTIETSNPKEARAIERYAHLLLRDHALRGEWFNVSPTQAINAIENAAVNVQAGKLSPFPKIRVPKIRPKTKMGAQIQYPTPVNMSTDEFRQRRTSLGLSQAAIAKIFGLARRTVQDWERGLAPIRPIVDLALQTLEAQRIEQDKAS